MVTYNNNSSKIIRQSILTMSYNSKVAHIPSAFSMCDYLGVLFDTIISPKTHQFVFGKPFGAQAYYALFAYFGWIDNDLSKYGSMDPKWRYIIQNSHPLVTYIDESMGNCLSVACGIATAGINVFVNISDAAFQEGTIWESVQYAGAKQLSNIIISIDNNNMQALGRISDISDLGNLSSKLSEFGWESYECDGHDIYEIQKVCERIRHSQKKKPIALVFHTSKGRGVSFMEGHSEWHYGILDDITYEKAIQELK